MLLNRHAFRFVAGDRRFFGPLAILGAWTVVAAAAAFQAMALVKLDGRADLLTAILGRLSIIPLWAAATPLIIRSARRFPVVRDDRRPNLTSAAAHLVLGSAFIVLANILIRVPFAFAYEGGLSALLRSTMQGVAEYYPPALVVYGVIVAIGHFLLRSPVSERQVPPPAPPPTGLDPESVTSASTVAGAHDVNQSEGVVSATDGHLAIRQWNRVHLVRVEDIDFVEAEDNYVVVHAASRSYKGRDRISDVESQLDARRFVRIHRSTIVHVAKIREVQPLTHGDHAVVLRDGKVLRVARSRRPALEQALGIDL
jgi:two-component system LytT family response regulator